MATKQGTVKKTPLVDFSRPRANGIIALGLSDEDALVAAQVTNGQNDIILFSAEGKAMRFAESDVRSMGRTARGVRGMRIDGNNAVISMVVVEPENYILTATSTGYGKRTIESDYPRKGRGGMGVISIKASERNGQVVSAISVVDEDEVMLISDGGTLVRTRVSEISSLGRNTQGVRLIKLGKNEQVVGMAKVQDSDDEEEIDEEALGNEEE